jgi:3-dehydroquinate dehydratase II
MDKILILNGPNLNLLGVREPHIYGPDTLLDIKNHTEKKLLDWKIQVNLEWFQSNLEGELITKVQEARSGYKALVINPGGYAHTSVALHDALKILTIPIVEVHLSQLYKREDFRSTLLTAKAATAIMTGLQKDSYALAVRSLIQ